MKFILLFNFILIYFKIDAQSYLYNVRSAQANSMGGIIGTTLSTESFIANASILSLIPESSLSINGEQRYLGTDITGAHFIAGIHTNKNNGFGLSIEHYGLPELNQSSVNGGYGMKLSKNVAIGAAAGLVLFNNIIDKSELAIKTQLSALYLLSPNTFVTGAYNMGFSARTDDLKINNFILGIHYEISPIVSSMVEFEKSIGLKPNLKIGIEYKILEKIILRVGVSHQPINFSTGIGFYLGKRLRLDTSLVLHQFLGLTPGCSVKYLFKKSANTP